MANKKISQLNEASSLNTTDKFAVVQSGETKQTTLSTLQTTLITNIGDDVRRTLIPTSLTCQATVNVDLDSSTYDDVELLVLTWSGATGQMTLSLPVASDHQNRLLRIITDTTYSTSTRSHLTPQGSDTLDGSTDYYEINKAYEGITVWSNGTEWFIIQKKA